MVAIGFYKTTVKATRGQASGDWVMVFNFRNGKIVRFREFTDSAAIVKAYGAPVSA